jgi:hypothetical protein
MATRDIRLPYDERRAFAPLHRRKQRWACLVAHRRAGKTVAVVNEIIIRALLTSPAAPYAYFAPFRSQAKAVAWDYFKHYSHCVKGKDPNEAELKISLINGSLIHLFGADNADAARGMGFGGVACDEYGDFRPSVWGNVIRPTLSDRKGWGLFMGTPKGHNQFYDVHRTSLNNPEWFSLTLKASSSGILDAEELAAARAQLSEDQYNQEYECSFEAAILGAYYGKEMMNVDNEGRICSVAHDPEFPVFTAWDIGHTDDTSIWFYQNVANQVRVLDHFAVSGGLIEDFIDGSFQPGSITEEVLKRQKERGYRYERHWLPHDARAKTLGSDGKSVVEKLSRYLGQSTLAIVPNLSIADGIQAVRTVLSRCWFDHLCNKDSTDGVEALRQYQREYDEDRKAFKTTPRHDWCSHPADAFRMLAVAERRRVAAIAKPQRPLVEEFRDVRRSTLDELWAEKEAAESRKVRI